MMIKLPTTWGRWVSSVLCILLCTKINTETFICFLFLLLFLLQKLDQDKKQSLFLPPNKSRGNIQSLTFLFFFWTWCLWSSKLTTGKPIENRTQLRVGVHVQKRNQKEIWWLPFYQLQNLFISGSLFVCYKCSVLKLQQYVNWEFKPKCGLLVRLWLTCLRKIGFRRNRELFIWNDTRTVNEGTIKKTIPMSIT